MPEYLSESEMRRLFVRRLFLATIILLPVQYALVGVVGLYWSEPWPALVMPSFQKVYDPALIAADATAVDVWFVDGGFETIPSAALLEPLPRSHHGALLQRRFRRAAAEAYWSENPSDARSWLLRRLREVYPEQSVARVDVVWFRTEYRLGAGGKTVTVQPTDTLTIRWQ